MSSDQSKKKVGLDKLRTSRRRSAAEAVADAVQEGVVDRERGFPALFEARAPDLGLTDWATANRERVEEALREHGGVLFRGFEPLSAGALEGFVEAMSDRALEYSDQATPRSRVEGNVYTSTEYAADQTIEMHNETVYAATWPRKLFFLCVDPADEGGETPVSDCRALLRHLDDDLVQRFRERRLMYVRNFGEGLGIPWQKAFGTDDREELEDWGRRHDVEIEWKGEGRLRTRQVRDAVGRHPDTGDRVWLNQAVAFHVSTLEPEIKETLLAEYGQEGVPKNVLDGDGTPIGEDTLEEIRDGYRHTAVAFPWQRGDLMLVDNVLLAHGRRPFKGSRQIVVGMSEPCGWEEVAA